MYIKIASFLYTQGQRTLLIYVTTFFYNFTAFTAILYGTNIDKILANTQKIDKILSPIKKRLFKYLDLKGVSRKNFYLEMKFSASNFKGKGAKSELGGDNIVKILTQYPDINPEWLLIGKGRMLRSFKACQNDDPDDLEILKTIGNKSYSYPLINSKIINDFGNDDFAIRTSDIKEYYVIPRFWNYNIDFMMEITGASMSPKYANGNLIACSVVRESQFIQWGRVYAIGTSKQGVLVRRLYPSKENKEQFECHADNQEFPPFEIHKQEITGLALVVGVIGLE